MENIKRIALDVDGILTDGSKLYDSSGNSTFKKFNDIDFTAIKVFKALGVEVIFITGDASNSWLAEKRNVKTYVTRLKDGSSISKEKVLNRHLKETGIKHDEVWFAGDDVFDISAMIISKYVSSPINSIDEVKKLSNVPVEKESGNFFVSEMLNIYLNFHSIKVDEELLKKIEKLDASESSSSEMA